MTDDDCFFFVDGSIHSIAEATIRFIDSFVNAVIPSSEYKQAIESSRSFSYSKRLVGTLPEVHLNVFYYIIAFMKELLKERYVSKNKLTAEHLDLKKL